MDTMEQIKDLARRMEDLCAEGELPTFDRIRLTADPTEVWFLWDDTKLAVVVELDAGAEALADALARATGGDPVMN